MTNRAGSRADVGALRKDEMLRALMRKAVQSALPELNVMVGGWLGASELTSIAPSQLRYVTGLLDGEAQPRSPRERREVVAKRLDDYIARLERRSTPGAVLPLAGSLAGFWAPGGGAPLDDMALRAFAEMQKAGGLAMAELFADKDLVEAIREELAIELAGRALALLELEGTRVRMREQAPEEEKMMWPRADGS